MHRGQAGMFEDAVINHLCQPCSDFAVYGITQKRNPSFMDAGGLHPAFRLGADDAEYVWRFIDGLRALLDDGRTSHRADRY
jgi:hypothetical protein